jgi:uncharacterized protein YkwD
MYRIISNLFVIGAFGLLVLTLAKPELADRAADRVLGIFIEIPTVPAERRTEPLTPSSAVSYLRTIKPVVGLQDSEKTATVVDPLDDETPLSNIIDATNRERIKEGLLPLVLNTKLNASARVKTNDMITRQYFEHDSPSGEDIADLARAQGYEYVIVGENLAFGDFVDGDDVVNKWMASAGHRANILNPKYQEIGVYAAKGTYQGRVVWFAVQHFGTNRSACPIISTSLKKTIDTTNKDLKQRQIVIAAEKAILEGSDRPSGEEYKERVAAFNAMVAEYNTALVLSQEKIKTYNAQVAAFNACLAGYQK